MSEEVKTGDTATPAPQPDPQPQIEIVDTPVVAPEVAAPAPAPAPPPLIFGKYRTPEDAEKAYSEAQRAMHEAKTEAAKLREQLEQRAAYNPPPPAVEPVTNFEDKFREQLAENPGFTIYKMIHDQTTRLLAQQQQANLGRLKEFQSFSSRPEYADVSAEVAAELPFSSEPMEMLFLRKRVAKLEAAGTQATREITPPHVEAGNAARRAGANSLRVELEPDTAKARRAYGEDKTLELARLVAKQKAAGGDMRGMSIDDWEKANA
ncbi:MAG TPA: hypothetical protein VI078_01500 [bacterium]